MRIALFALLVLVVGGAAAFWLQSGNDPVAPPSPSAPDERPMARRPAEPAASERTRVAPPPQRAADAQLPPQQQQAGAAAPGDAPAAPRPDEPPVTVTLHVRDASSGADLAPFRFRFVMLGETVSGDSDAPTAQLRLPAGATGQLLVEADGMQPAEAEALTVPTQTQPALHRDVFLTPTPTGAGITLLVRDVARQPVTSVRVEAFEVGAHNRELSWQIGQALWSRAASADDGNYELPPLPAGEYGILLLAIDEQGEPRPLLPYRRVFTLTGSNGFVEDATLEPGCHLLLDMVEPNGDAFDPALHGRITIGLRPAGAPPFERIWTSRDADGRLVRAQNGMPAKGRVWANEPLPAGAYRLEVFVNGDPRVDQTLLLRAGEAQTVRVVVR